MSLLGSACSVLHFESTRALVRSNDGFQPMYENSTASISVKDNVHHFATANVIIAELK